MESIELNINNAIYFINEYLKERKENDSERCKLILILSNDILKLDGMDRLYQRKEMIIAIDNVLNQLEVLYHKKSAPIQIPFQNSQR